MKIRNGFVSNSSSSSFILAYDATKVLNRPEEIIEFVRNNPDKRVIIRGRDLSEGEDIFELEEDQKKMIRCFPDKFIDLNTGTEPDIMGENPHRPKIRAYVENFHLVKEDEHLLYSDNLDVDMSDVVEPEEIPMRDMNRWLTLKLKKDTDALEENEKEEYENLAVRIKADNAYYDLRHERIEKKRKELLEKERNNELQRLIKEGTPEENAVLEEVLIDDWACEEDEYKFAERYLSSSSFDLEDSYYLRGLREEGDCDKPYIVFYENMISGKEEILKYLETSKTRDYIFWSNPVFNVLPGSEKGIDIDFFEVGEKEKEILKKNLLKNPREVHLLTNAYIEDSDVGEISRPSKFMIGYGKAVIINKGYSIPDFERNLEVQIDED